MPPAAPQRAGFVSEGICMAFAFRLSREGDFSLRIKSWRLKVPKNRIFRALRLFNFIQPQLSNVQTHWQKTSMMRLAHSIDEIKQSPTVASAEVTNPHNNKASNTIIPAKVITILLRSLSTAVCKWSSSVL